MLYIGIDLGGTGIKAGVVNDKGEILSKASCPTLPERGYEAVIRDMAKLAIAVTEKSEVLTLTKEVKWAGYLSDWDGPADSEAPAAYLILLSPESTGVSQIDVGIAAETILLAAAEAGVGGCMILNFPREALTERYKLASNYKIELVISLGVPAEKVEIETMKEGNVRYYRDENDVHHVPKRALSEEKKKKKNI